MMRWVIILEISLLCTGIFSQSICQRNIFNTSCQITADSAGRVVVDCSARYLKCIPRVPTNTRELSLDRNDIRIANFTLDCFRQLEVLNLANNYLRKIQRNSFTALGNLKVLSLSNNFLHGPYSYSDNSLSPLRSLISLEIQGNCELGIGDDCGYPNAALETLETLQQLVLDGYDEAPLGKGFLKLKNLTDLKFAGYCRFENFSRTIFENLVRTSIVYFTLEKCDISHIEKGVFGQFPGLKYLRVSRSRRLCSAGLRNVTFDLYTTQIKELVLDTNCDDACVKYPADVFEGLKTSKLKTLQWLNNNAASLEYKALFNLPNDTLTKIVFREKHMKEGTESLALAGALARLGELEDFDLGFATKHSSGVTSSLLSSSNSNTNAHQELNAIGKVCVFLKCIFYIPKKLRKVYFRDSAINFQKLSGKSSISPQNSLAYLDLSGGSTDAFYATVDGLNKVSYLNISNSNLIHLSDGVVATFPSLEILDLSFNNIGEWLGKPGINHFPHPSLEEMYLGHNHIQTLACDFLANQPNLRTLSLYANNLEAVTFRMNQLKSLEFLALDYNNIGALSGQNMDDLDELAAAGRPIKISLVKNPLLCHCSNTEFIRWFGSTRVAFVDLHNTTCTYRNGSQLSLKFHSSIAHQLFTDCMVIYVTTGCVFGAILLLLILSVVAVMYNKRWQIRYLYYVGKFRFDPLSPVQDGHSEGGGSLLHLDAYISFDEHCEMPDGRTLRDLVTRTVLPELSSRGHRVQIREELPPGVLTTSIGNAIRNSDKVIVLLSRGYCKEFYNTYEFNMAAMQSIYTRRKVILPIQVSKFIYPEDVSEDVLKFLVGAKLYRLPVGTASTFLSDFIQANLKQQTSPYSAEMTT